MKGKRKVNFKCMLKFLKQESEIKEWLEQRLSE